MVPTSGNCGPNRDNERGQAHLQAAVLGRGGLLVAQGLAWAGEWCLLVATWEWRPPCRLT